MLPLRMGVDVDLSYGGEGSLASRWALELDINAKILYFLIFQKMSIFPVKTEILTL